MVCIGIAARLIPIFFQYCTRSWSLIISKWREPPGSCTARSSDVIFVVVLIFSKLDWSVLTCTTLTWITSVWTCNYFRPCCTFSNTWWYLSSTCPHIFLVAEQKTSPISSRSPSVRTSDFILVDLVDFCFLRGPIELRFYLLLILKGNSKSYDLR